MTANVFAALAGAGSLKFGTALDMASTPVKAEHPEAKAFSNKNREMPATGVPTDTSVSGGTAPVTILYRLVPISNNMAKMNK